jgi:two-component system nitrate/nitrite response regulator NarL
MQPSRQGNCNVRAVSNSRQSSSQELHRELRKLIYKYFEKLELPIREERQQSGDRYAVTDVELNGFTYILTRVRTKDRKLLSQRQLQIALLVEDGLANKTIAQRLGISAATVAVHIQRIYRKLNIDSRAELARHTVLLC